MEADSNERVHAKFTTGTPAQIWPDYFGITYFFISGLSRVVHPRDRTTGHHRFRPSSLPTCARQRAATTTWRQWHCPEHAGGRARRQDNTSLRQQDAARAAVPLSSKPRAKRNPAFPPRALGTMCLPNGPKRTLHTSPRVPTADTLRRAPAATRRRSPTHGARTTLPWLVASGLAEPPQRQSAPPHPRATPPLQRRSLRAPRCTPGGAAWLASIAAASGGKQTSLKP